MKKAIVLLAVIGLIAAGCEKKPEAATNDSTATQPASTAPDPHAGVADPHARGIDPAVLGNAGPLDQADIKYDLPSNWQRVPPASTMRLDQAKIPGGGGEGELAVFFFGAGGGGGVDANLARWAGQIEGGAPAKRESFDVGSYRVTWIDASGTLMPSGMSSGPSEPQKNSRLFGAVVEGNGGPWFFKATGPDATMAGERSHFIDMLKSIRASL